MKMVIEMEQLNNKTKCTNFKHRTDEEKAKLTKRLNVISGQINGIKEMINNDRYCEDILIQVSAVNRSLKSVGNEIMKSHVSTCVIDELKHENFDAIEDIVDLFDRLNK